MRVAFVVQSNVVGAKEARWVVGRNPDRAINIGEKVGKSDKIAETNFCRFDLGDFQNALDANSRMIEFLIAIAERAGAIDQAYKHFDITIEIGSLEEDFSMSDQLIEKMRSLEVQIEIDITRY